MALDLVGVNNRGLPTRHSKRRTRQVPLHQISTLRSLCQVVNLSQGQRNRRRQHFIITLSTHLDFWHGMRPGSWWNLLRQGRFRIHPSRLLMAVAISFATPFNTLLAMIQAVIFRRKLAEAELHGPPVFIVGNWRSGTTLLHELMVRDERLSSPSTFQCFAPCHFLVTEWFFRRFASWLLPGKRPMDNMAAGWDRPQEDEFALMNLGQPSPYRRIAFPNEPAVDMDYLDFDGVPEEGKQQWMTALRSFLLKVSIGTGASTDYQEPYPHRACWLVGS